VLEHLAARPGNGAWWLGFLDKGGTDSVFPDAPRVTMYAGWAYVLVLAGPEQAATWNRSLSGAVLPELIFPVDRSWLLSTLWDDSWSCLGGPPELIQACQEDLRLRTNPVSIDEDMTPSGHTMR
jgi:hypothetical protein